MNMIKVESSNIDAIGYDHGDLYVRFKGGEGKNNRIYVYYDVPEHFFKEILEAESKGKYLNQNIKGKFTYRKTEG